MTNTAQTQYYLIPPNHPLSPGDFIIRTATGEELAVNQADIAAFEISEAEAEAHIKTQLDEGLAQTKTALAQAWERARHKARARREAHETHPPSKLVKSLLGFNAAELRANPELAEETIHRFFTGLQTVLESVTSDDPAKQEVAQAQMRALREKLEESGFDPGQKLEQLPDRLRAAFFSGDRTQRLRDTAANLEQAAEQIDQAAASAEQGLRQEAARLKRQADQIEQLEADEYKDATAGTEKPNNIDKPESEV